MRTFASKIVDTFQIENRGTALLLAIPSDANLTVSIGDTVHVDSARGQSSTCEVLGVEMARGLPREKCGLALLVRSVQGTNHFSRGDLVWTERRTSEEFLIPVLWLSFPILDETFVSDDSRHLVFAYSSRSVVPASTAELSTGSIEFQDYIMEGFVRYLVSVVESDDTMALKIGLLGTNRDRYVRPHLEFQLRSFSPTTEAPNNSMDRSGGSTAS